MKNCIKFLIGGYLSFQAFAAFAQATALSLSESITPKTVYRDCQHTFHAKEATSWQYASDNGQIRVSPSGDITVIPASVGAVHISASKGSTHQKLVLDCVEPPQPDYLLVNGQGQAVPLNKPLNINDVQSTTYQLVVEPDAVFEKVLPHDANYHIKAFEVVLFRDGKAIGTHTLSNAQDIRFASLELDKNLPTEERTLRSGDGIQIILKSVVRVSASGKEIDTPILRPYISVLLN